MLTKFKRGLRRAEESLSRPFRGRGRKQGIYLDHMDWDGLESLIGVLDQRTGSLQQLGSAVGKLSECIRGLDDQARAREGYRTLRTDLNGLLQALAGYIGASLPLEVTEGRLMNLVRGIGVETELLLREKEKEPERGKRLAEDMTEVMKGCSRLRTLLARFVLTENTDIWKIMGEAIPDTNLDRLPHPMATWYNSSGPDSPRRNGCTPNTCVDVLQQLRVWSRYNNHGRACWLNGTAGTGKTTIAYNLCEHSESVGKLAVSFFCTRRLPHCRDANAILPSICHQLSLFSRPFRYAISDVINQNVDGRSLPIQEQFDSLIAAPLRKVGHTLPVDAIVVIDALDECEDDDGVGLILDALLAHASQSSIKFFLTSRPEPKIVHHMQKNDDMFVKQCLHELDHSVAREDIKTYMRAELAPANPSANDLERLAELSGPNFEYAAIFARYILRGYLLGGNERVQRLKRLLDTPTSPQGNDDKRMDPTYTAFLEAALEVDTVGGPKQAETTLVLHTIICAREAFTVETLAGLLRLSVARLLLHPLQSLRLVIQISETSGLVTPRHASFLNYLLDQKRSERFYCDGKQHGVWLAQTCFGLVEAPGPLPDDRNLEPSRTQVRVGRDIKDRVKEVITPELLYAYRYWGLHQELAGQSASEAAERLKRRLDDFTTSEIDAFYTILLQRGFDACMMRGSSTDEIMQVLRTVARPPGPLTVTTMVDLLEIKSANLVQSLVPLLEISDVSGQVTILHDSLSSYLLDEGRSGKFYCDAGQHNSWLAQTCFDLIKVPSPPFNICKLPSSYLLDQEVPDLEQRIDGAISPRLFYACQYWGAHLAASSASDALLEGMHEFLSTRLLLWMEILNLKRRIADGISILDRLLSWLRGVECSNNVRQLVEDAWRFIMLFSHSPLSDSTPHIYISMLPFWPENRPVSTHYLPRMAGLVRVTGGMMGSAHPGLVATLDAGSSVFCVAYSPDGAYIASGTYSGAVRFWDAHTGQPAGQALSGHKGLVRSVAYSPNGAYIVSGSRDKTIRIWDAHTRKPVGPALEGHTGPVNSVAYSPDGAYIVSGSDDITIRIWDAHTGKAIGGPLKDHRTPVRSVVYSPSGRLVSGSFYDTYTWDTSTQRPVGKPLGGHEGIVNSVGHSPNGAYIISGCGDNNIRIWDSHTGNPIGQPLRGHTDAVCSAVYSPDGAYIASGSVDKTIRIWDARTGQAVGHPLKGHTDIVWSVAYSPDGAYIVSGCRDGTLYMWDTSARKPAGQQPKCHTDAVFSAAYSSDGAYVVSGSGDKTVCIREVHTGRAVDHSLGGQTVGLPLSGHKKRVHSVSYSPDCTYIVPASDDNTGRVWAAHIEQPLGPSAEDSPERVQSTVYSADRPNPAPDNAQHPSRTPSLTTPDRPSDPKAYGVVLVTSLRNCSLNSQGWMMDANQNRLVWVPPHVRETLLPTRNILVIPFEDSRVDFHGAVFGEEWQRCLDVK